MVILGMSEILCHQNARDMRYRHFLDVRKHRFCRSLIAKEMRYCHFFEQQKASTPTFVP